MPVIRPRFLLASLLSTALALSSQAQENVLLIVADDLGADQLAAYGIGTDLPSTPVLDGLAAQGILFENVWANPVCSPTRATLLSGRYSFRTGVGDIATNGQPGLPLTEFTLPRLLDLATGGEYTHGAFGKWHLAGPNNGGVFSPGLLGFSHFAGTLAGLDPFYSYFAWDQLENGSFSSASGYNTSRIVDDVLAWTVGRQEPWFAYVAFNAPHSPYHAPPAELHTVDFSGALPPQADPRPYYKAMVEALDTEIGRLLTGLGPALANTTVIFVGDNGTPSEVIAPPLDPLKAKKTLFEGGVHVPLIVTGPRVTARGKKCDALVNTTDLAETVVELAGGPPLAVLLPALWPHDSVSLVSYLSKPAASSKRQFAFAEIFAPNGFGPKAFEIHGIRGPRYKLVRSIPFLPFFGDRMTDLARDPHESIDLLEDPPLAPQAQLAFRKLSMQMKALLKPALKGPLIKQAP